LDSPAKPKSRSKKNDAKGGKLPS